MNNNNNIVRLSDLSGNKEYVGIPLSKHVLLCMRVGMSDCADFQSELKFSYDMTDTEGQNVGVTLSAFVLKCQMSTFKNAMFVIDLRDNRTTDVVDTTAVVNLLTKSDIEVVDLIFFNLSTDNLEDNTCRVMDDVLTIPVTTSGILSFGYEHDTYLYVSYGYSNMQIDIANSLRHRISHRFGEHIYILDCVTDIKVPWWWTSHIFYRV